MEGLECRQVPRIVSAFAGVQFLVMLVCFPEEVVFKRKVALLAYPQIEPTSHTQLVVFNNSEE